MTVDQAREHLNTLRQEAAASATTYARRIADAEQQVASARGTAAN